MSLGVMVEGGLMNNIIESNTSIPIELTKTYSTADDNQTEVEIEVYEGE